tara:strand:+ start:582 stop:761 length:180 start_codon:yes stop_codon:yes gene_type:complete
MNNKELIKNFNNLLNLDEDSEDRYKVLGKGYELLKVLEDGMRGDDEDGNDYLIIKLDRD